MRRDRNLLYLVLASLAAGVWLHWGPPQRRSG